MAFPLALIPLIAAAAGGIAKAAPSVMTDPTERRNKQKLAELQAREEAGALGMTPEETQQFVSQRASLLGQGQDEQMRRLSRAAAGGVGIGAGDIQAQALAQQTQAAQEALRSQAELTKLQMEAAQRDRQEIEDRTEAVTKRKQARRKALGDIVSGAALGAGNMAGAGALTGPR